MPVNAIQFWEFPVQWAEKFSVVSTFKTEIISSYSGKEQRRAMRYYPRRSFDFKLDALPSVVDEVQFFLTTAQRNVVVMPEPVRSRRTTSILAKDQAIVDVTSIAPWMQEGGYVAMIAGSRVQVFQIADIFASSLAFTEVATDPWPGNTRIVPAWKGLLSESISFSLPTSRIMQGGIEFAVLPGEENTLPPEPEFGDYVYSRELFDFRTNWGEAPSVDYVQSRQIVDYDRGVIALFTPVAYASRTYSTDILNFNPTQAYRLTEFFERMKGRRGEFFFAPPGRAQMILAADMPEGSDTILLKGDDARLAYVGDPTLRMISISMREGGIVHYRKVVSATAQNGNTLLTLDLGVPELISEDMVKSVTWLALARFESDELTVDWETTNVSTARVVVRALEYAEPEDLIDVDEGTRWLMDYFGARFVESVIVDPLLKVLNDKEPRFALKIDDGAQYLIDTYGRDVVDRWTLDLTDRVVNVTEPRFAEIEQ